MYTFLAIAPCNFTVNGKHFSVEAGTPIQVEYNEALIMSAPTFRYRNYLRVITPIKPPTPAEPESITLTEPTIEPTTEPEVKPNRRAKTKKESVVSSDLKETKEETQINTEVINLF